MERGKGCTFGGAVVDSSTPPPLTIKKYIFDV